jgi:hypothetical protein
MELVRHEIIFRAYHAPSLHTVPVANTAVDLRLPLSLLQVLVGSPVEVLIHFFTDTQLNNLATPSFCLHSFTLHKLFIDPPPALVICDHKHIK